ncbi:unnamed protein product [Lathyrus oleraceus]
MQGFVYVLAGCRSRWNLGGLQRISNTTQGFVNAGDATTCWFYVSTIFVSVGGVQCGSWYQAGMLTW